MKVLISRPDKIGDVILALHAVKQLKLLMPESKIYLHVQEYTIPIVENINFIEGYVKVGEDLNQYKFDAVVDLMAKSNMALDYYRSNIKIRIGNAARWFRLAYNRTAYIRRSKAIYNEAEYNWKLISLLSKEFKNTSLTNSVIESDWKDIVKYETNSEYTVIMPGISASAIPWNIQRWKDLAQSIQDKFKHPVYFLIGPAEAKLKEQYQTDNPNIETKTFSKIPELLGFLKSAKFYVGPSTGITHLAGTLGLKGVAIYPEKLSMHPRRWQAFNTNLRVVSMDRNPTDLEIIQILDNEHVERIDPLAKHKISAFVITLNEEKNIRRCLDSLKWCDEIILVDSGSTDKTLEIAKNYTDKIFYRAWSGHSDQKRYGLSLCSNEWVLNVDADEQVSAELIGNIQVNLALNNKKLSKISGFNINRVVYFLNKWWDRGGWCPEYRLRLFRKSATTWGGVNPHEKAIVNGKIQKITGDLYHYTYRNFEHQMECLNKHSTTSAVNLFKQNQKIYLYNIFLNPIFRFFKFYIMKKGFLEGLEGLLVAIIEAHSTFLKYTKLWELNKQINLKSVNNLTAHLELPIVQTSSAECQTVEKHEERQDRSNA